MIYLLLGANLGDRVATLKQATNLINDRVGVVVQESALYETAAWGVTNQPSFLNQVLAVETELKPEELLRQTQAIEQELGRVRLERWGARVIDIDVLYYDQLVWQTTTLTVPHPYLHQRRFTLVPLADIAPSFVHPILGKTNQKLLTEVTDSGQVVEYVASI
jgi:2-amino-4-hydroxy-6-hydroxymethyldihydropteridine diphosphokinase